MKKMHSVLLASALFFMSTHILAQGFDAEDEALGLYPENSMSVTGTCTDCVTTGKEQMLWYFSNEKIATKKWEWDADSTQENMSVKDLPPLVWVGADSVLTNASISEDGKQLVFSDASLRLAPKIPSNLSYWDDSTLKFFTQRSVRIRGDWSREALDYAGKKPADTTADWLTAHVVWPEDFNIDLTAYLQPLAEDESLKSLVQFENGGAKSNYESRLLWAKNTNPTENLPRQLAGKTVLGFMLNGAQGDDDEARGGHFAVVTGRLEADGDYSRWLVNNYYNLASNSEKGIIAAVTPMDKYLVDLNSGQSFYRPSYMLVAVLKTDAISAQFQAAANKSFEHFYANDFVYDHSRNNCTGISMDILRKLGWDIPTRGVESQLKATVAYFYVATTEMSLTKGRAIYDYLNTETTRLFPAVAFDAIGENLLQLTRQLQPKDPPKSAFIKQLNDDIEAIYFIRIPQIPSSRAFGMAPVYSFGQYMQEAPADRKKWKIVPTTPNPLPEALVNEHAQKLQAQARPFLVPWPVLVVGLLVLGFAWLTRKYIKRHSQSSKILT